MSLREQMQPAVTAFFDPAAHGVEVLYEYQRVNVLFSGDDGRDVFSGGKNSGGKSSVLFVRVLVSSVPDPQYNDLLIVDDVHWRMKKVLSSGRFSTKLQFERDRRPVL